MSRPCVLCPSSPVLSLHTSLQFSHACHVISTLAHTTQHTTQHTHTQTTHTATNSDTLTPSLLFSCGVVAGLAASIITQPADVVKTSVQTGTVPRVAGSTTGLLPTVSSIYQRGGMRAMFAGVAPRVTRRTLMAAFTWALYEQVSTLSLSLTHTLYRCKIYVVLFSLQMVLLVDSRFQ